MTTMTIRNDPRVRTTINLPSSLLDRSQRFVDQGVVTSRTTLIEIALERLLEELEEEEIDRQFAAITDDQAYHSLNVSIDHDFAVSDWEVLVQAEERREA